MSGEFTLLPPEVYCSFAPYWKDSVLYSKRYMTTILESEDGTEQRLGIASKPVRGESFTIQTRDQRQTGYIRRRLMKYVGHIWGVPIWPFEMIMSNSGEIGASFVEVYTSLYRQLASGEEEIIIVSDYETFETFRILGSTPTQITLSGELTQAWSQGTKIYPVLRSLVGMTVDLSPDTPEHTNIKMDFVESFRASGEY